MNWNEISELYDTDKAFMYENAILVFDTSSLLELYFYSTNSAIEILEKCNYHFKDRIFLPNHVKFEYDKNREIIIKKQTLGYQNVFNKNDSIGFFAKIIYQQEMIKKMITDTNNAIKNFEQQFGNRQTHPYFSSVFIEEFKTEVNNFTLKLADIENSKIFSDFEDKLMDETEARITEITNQIEQDNLKEFIENNFTIGDDYSFPELMDIISEGELRYSASIPPGYMDAEEKQSIQVYGDLIIWKQILKHAQSQSKPVIFVSDDTKEDWNEIIEGEEANKKKKRTDSRRPRYEILLEFKDIVGKKIKKLKLSDFLYELNEQLETKFGSSTISEIKYKSLKETIEDEAFNFVRALEKKVERTQGSGLDPDFAYYYYDEIDNVANLSSIDKISLNDLGEGSYQVEYLAKFDCSLEREYFEYWGRDDDTKEEITSPAGNISVSGELLVKIKREIRVEFGEDFYPNIEDEEDPDFEIIEDNRDVYESSWEDGFYDEDLYDYY